MGVISQAVAEVGDVRRGPRCTVAVVLDLIDGVDRADLLDTLSAPLVAHTTIERAMSTTAVSEKYPDLPRLRADGIRRHRNRACSCQ